jgi:hypothetical protein
MARTAVRTGSGQREYLPLPKELSPYYMRIRSAETALSNFKDKDGNDQYQLLLTWELTRLTDEQVEAEVDESRWVKQWISLYYGETAKGPSKLKVFIDELRSQGLLEDFDPDAEELEVDDDWFVGIEQKVTLGVKGEFNEVLMISNPRPPKRAGAAAPPAPKKNAPQHVSQAPKVRPAANTPADEDDSLFEEPPF